MFEIVKETGYTLHYVLWKVSRANLYLMMADRSRFENTNTKPKEVLEYKTGHDLAARLNK